MVKDKIKLSEIGMLLFDKAIKDTKIELKLYDRVRTKFYYPIDDEIGVFELRGIIDNLVEEFGLKFPFGDRDSKYFKFISTKAFDVVRMKIHRLAPNNYIVVTRKDDGPIIFMIRDKSLYPDNNLRVAWDSDKLDKGKIDELGFHLTSDMLSYE